MNSKGLKAGAILHVHGVHHNWPDRSRQTSHALATASNSISCTATILNGPGSELRKASASRSLPASVADSRRQWAFTGIFSANPLQERAYGEDFPYRRSFEPTGPDCDAFGHETKRNHVVRCPFWIHTPAISLTSNTSRASATAPVTAAAATMTGLIKMVLPVGLP